MSYLCNGGTRVVITLFIRRGIVPIGAKAANIMNAIKYCLSSEPGGRATVMHLSGTPYNQVPGFDKAKALNAFCEVKNKRNVFK